MGKNVIWSSLAENDFSKLLYYLDTEWNSSVSAKFINLLDYSINQIQNNPQLYPIIHSKLNIRRCVLTKHNSLYYRELTNAIQILRIFDSRQNPNSLLF